MYESYRIENISKNNYFEFIIQGIQLTDIPFINFDKNSISHIAIYSLTKPKVCDRKK